MKDSTSGKSKGYGFVSFLKKEVCILGFCQSLLSNSVLIFMHFVFSFWDTALVHYVVYSYSA